MLTFYKVFILLAHAFIALILLRGVADVTARVAVSFNHLSADRWYLGRGSIGDSPNAATE